MVTQGRLRQPLGFRNNPFAGLGKCTKRRFPANCGTKIGAPISAATLQKANALFGPSPHRKERQRQLRKIRFRAIDPLNKEFYANSENLYQLLYIFAADHADSFKAK